ncbi:MAG: hypothetical protein ACYTEO_15100 [Planctomycetota bacterium]
MKRIIYIALIFTVLSVSCTKEKDSANEPLTAKTPEGAILLLEDAYNRKDLEAAIKLKDFNAEARYMLKDAFKDMAMNEDIVQKPAETLELAYRNEMASTGMPDFTNLQSTFPKKVELGDGYWRVTEKCKFPDGGYSQQDIKK